LSFGWIEIESIAEIIHMYVSYIHLIAYFYYY